MHFWYLAYTNIIVSWWICRMMMSYVSSFSKKIFPTTSYELESFFFILIRCKNKWGEWMMEKAVRFGSIPFLLLVEKWKRKLLLSYSLIFPSRILTTRCQKRIYKMWCSCIQCISRKNSYTTLHRIVLHCGNIITLLYHNPIYWWMMI